LLPPRFGKRLWADLEFGFYLPFAKKDYESSYMANRRLGGNLIFDDIHEIDLAVCYGPAARGVLFTRDIVRPKDRYGRFGRYDGQVRE
jgi:hypothetical protein